LGQSSYHNEYKSIARTFDPTIADQNMFGEGCQVFLPDMFHGFFHEHLHFEANL
jgi:hypothetical protein